MTTNLKEEIIALIKKLPEDATIDDIMSVSRSRSIANSTRSVT